MKPNVNLRICLLFTATMWALFSMFHNIKTYRYKDPKDNQHIPGHY